MMSKRRVEDLAAFGAAPLFSKPRSTSNLVRPDFERFLTYSRPAVTWPGATEGRVNAQFEARMASFHGVGHCVSFCSGFWALAVTISLLALPGRREVVMPSLTYRRMADVVAWTGLLPRFCEVDSNTLGITAESAQDCLGDDTALLMAVHPIVNCCDVEGLTRLAEVRGVPLFFDAVESVFEHVPQGKTGGFGKAECFSLHASKLINGFEGGYITTNDAALADALRMARSGKMAGKGAIDARMSEVHAAMALASMDCLDEQVERNRQRYLRYREVLANVSGIRLLAFDESQPTSYKNIVVEFLEDWPLPRSLTIELLNAERILARAYYSPALHAKPMAYPHIPATLPLTDRLAERFALMPCGEFVSLEDIDEIVELLAFLRANAGGILARAAEEMKA